MENHTPDQTATKNPKKHTIAYILVVVLLTAAAGYGAYYWQHAKLASSQHRNATLTAEKAALQSQLQQSQSSNKANEVKLADAAQLVTNFYKQYGNSVASRASEISLIKQYGTSNLAFYAEYYQHGFDNILCAQTTPQHLSVNGVGVTDNVATTIVTEAFGNTNVSVTVKVVNQGGLKIDSVACSGAEGNLPAPPAMN